MSKNLAFIRLRQLQYCLQEWRDNVGIEWLVIASLVALIFNLSLSISTFSIWTLTFWFLLISVVLIYSQDWGVEGKKIENFLSKYGIWPLVYLASFLCFLLEYTITPGWAQFYNNAEQWMTSKFNTAGNANITTAISLVFSVLRGLFLIYLAIAIIRIVQSARQDEDWQTLAKTPLIITSAVVVGDALVTLIIG